MTLFTQPSWLAWVLIPLAIIGIFALAALIVCCSAIYIMTNSAVQQRFTPPEPADFTERFKAKTSDKNNLPKLHVTPPTLRHADDSPFTEPKPSVSTASNGFKAKSVAQVNQSMYSGAD